MLSELGRCNFHIKNYENLFGEEKLKKFQKGMDPEKFNINCKDPSEKVNNIQEEFTANLPKPKRFAQRIFLSDEEMRMEFANRAELKENEKKLHQIIYFNYRLLNHAAVSYDRRSLKVIINLINGFSRGLFWILPFDPLS
jgi:hypothetical protein